MIEPDRFYVIDLQPREDDDLCYFQNPPDIVNKYSFLFTGGESATEEVGGHEIRWRMESEEPGTGLSGLIGNNCSLLLLHRALAEAIQSLPNESMPIECFPIIIVNHKGRIASRDYRLLNPVGAIDCLDKDKCDAVRSKKDGSILDVRVPVFRRSTVDSRRHSLIRFPEDPAHYCISGRALEEIKKQTPFKHSNLHFDSIPWSDEVE